MNKRIRFNRKKVVQEKPEPKKRSKVWDNAIAEAFQHLLSPAREHERQIRDLYASFTSNSRSTINVRHLPAAAQPFLTVNIPLSISVEVDVHSLHELETAPRGERELIYLQVRDILRDELEAELREVRRQIVQGGHV